MLSVVRGYFQGRGNMYPTAITEISEQVIKVAFGVALSYYFRENLALAVASTLFSVTVSEVLSTVFAAVWYLRKKAVKVSGTVYFKMDETGTLGCIYSGLLDFFLKYQTAAINCCVLRCSAFLCFRWSAAISKAGAICIRQR